LPFSGGKNTKKLDIVNRRLKRFYSFYIFAL